jgi:hypothetical protein
MDTTVGAPARRSDRNNDDKSAPLCHRCQRRVTLRIRSVRQAGVSNGALVLTDRCSHDIRREDGTRRRCEQPYALVMRSHPLQVHYLYADDFKELDLRVQLLEREIAHGEGR